MFTPWLQSLLLRNWPTLLSRVCKARPHLSSAHQPPVSFLSTPFSLSTLLKLLTIHSLKLLPLHAFMFSHTLFPLPLFILHIYTFLVISSRVRPLPNMHTNWITEKDTWKCCVLRIPGQREGVVQGTHTHQVCLRHGGGWEHLWWDSLWLCPASPGVGRP